MIMPCDYTIEERGYETPCHIWKHRFAGAGKYPVIRDLTKSVWSNGDYPVHKLVWEELHGPMLKELVPDHLCRVHQCINGEHIEAVTNRENIMRGSGVHDTCKRGHAFTEENTYWYGPNKTRRKCRTCQKSYAWTK